MDKNSWILCNDVLELILHYINCRQLFQLEITSKQFHQCIRSVLRQRQCLRFGKTNEPKLCRRPQHQIHESIEYRDLKSVITKKTILSLGDMKTVIDKCPNIRCLYLNQELNLTAIELMVNSLVKLECLCLGSNFLTYYLNDLQTIGRLFGDRIRHLSIECYFQEEDIHQNVAQLIQHFKVLQRLRVIHFKPLHTALASVSDSLISLEIDCSPFWFSDSLDDRDVQTLLSLITDRKLKIRCLHIVDYHISDQMFSQICRLLQLQELSISCHSLSLTQIVKQLSCNRQSLDYLSVTRLIADNGLQLDPKRYPLNVKHLRLNSCHFDVKSFDIFRQTLQSLEKLEINGLYIQCECDQQSSESYFCPNCDQKCFASLAKLGSLKVLHLLSSFTCVHYLTKHLIEMKSLTKLRVNYILLSDMKLLAINLVTICRQMSTKQSVTIEFIGSQEKCLFMETITGLYNELMPRNLIIK